MQDRKERYSFNKLGRKRNVVCKEIIDRENCQNGKKKKIMAQITLAKEITFIFKIHFQVLITF